MTALLTPLNDDRRFLIACAWKPFKQFQRWPFFDYIEAECDKHGLDARKVLASLPELPLHSVAGFRYGAVWCNSHMPAADTPILLRVVGLHHLGEPFALEMANEFVRVLGYLIERRLTAPSSPFKLNTVTVTNTEIAQQFPNMTPAIMKSMRELLSHEPTTWHGTRPIDTSNDWAIDIYRSILKFRGVSMLDEYLQRVDELLTPPEVERAPAIYFNAVWQLQWPTQRGSSRLYLVAGGIGQVGVVVGLGLDQAPAYRRFVSMVRTDDGDQFPPLRVRTPVSVSHATVPRSESPAWNRSKKLLTISPHAR